MLNRLMPNYFYDLPEELQEMIYKKMWLNVMQQLVSLKEIAEHISNRTTHIKHGTSVLRRCLSHLQACKRNLDNVAERKSVASSL